MRGITLLVDRKLSFAIPDCILVIQDGKITEMGNHNELMQKGGFYSTLYNSQFN